MLAGHEGAPAAEIEGCRLPLGADEVQMLACDATLHRITVDKHGMPLDVGRATRVISPALRRALMKRDAGCVFPDCDVPGKWCDAHHVTWWTRGGKTALRNTGLVCRRHHRLLHYEGWRLVIEPGRRPYAVPPNT